APTLIQSCEIVEHEPRQCREYSAVAVRGSHLSRFDAAGTDDGKHLVARAEGALVGQKIAEQPLAPTRDVPTTRGSEIAANVFGRCADVENGGRPIRGRGGPAELADILEAGDQRGIHVAQFDMC